MINVKIPAATSAGTVDCSVAIADKDQTTAAFAYSYLSRKQPVLKSFHPKEAPSGIASTNPNPDPKLNNSPNPNPDLHLAPSSWSMYYNFLPQPLTSTVDLNPNFNPNPSGTAGTKLSVKVQHLDPTSAVSVTVGDASPLMSAAGAVSMEGPDKNGIFTLSFDAPSASAGTVTVTVAEVADATANATFSFLFRDAAVPFIAFMKPITAVITDTNVIDLQVANLAAATTPVKATMCGVEETLESTFSQAKGSLFRNGYKVSVPAACTLGSQNVVVAIEGTSTVTETKAFTLTAPPVAVEPQRGTSSGGNSITVSAYGLPKLTSTSDVTVNFGSTKVLALA